MGISICISNCKSNIFSHSYHPDNRVVFPFATIPLQMYEYEINLQCSIRRLKAISCGVCVCVCVWGGGGGGGGGGWGGGGGGGWGGGGGGGGVNEDNNLCTSGYYLICCFGRICQMIWIYLTFSLSTLRREKWAPFFQTTFSNAFGWMKILFWSKFHSSLFPRVR